MRTWRCITILAAMAGLCTTACQMMGTPPVSTTPVVGPAAAASPIEFFGRQERLRIALEGLSFDTGLVTIDEQMAAQIIGRGDANLARQRCDQAETLLYERNDPVGAIGTYKEAVLIDPELSAAYYGLGRALIGKGKTAEALAAYRTALQLHPDYADAQFQLGLTLAMEGRLQEAVAAYHRLIELDPDYPDAYARLAIAHYYLGELDAARAAAAAAEASGYPAPPQFVLLLEGRMPAPRLIRDAGVQVGPQVRIDTNGGTFAANETTMASTDQNPMEVVGAWNDWRDSYGTTEIIRVGVAVSLDGGATWTDFHVRPPAQNQSSVEGDPMTCYDHRTGTLWVGGISFTAGSKSGVFVARKDPGATTFQPSVMAKTSSWPDKGWMAAGAAPGNPNQTYVYCTYNEGCLRSTNMGANWTGPVSLGYGLGFLPRVGPNGELYVAYWDVSTGVKLARSFDGGQSFTTHHIATRMDVWGVQDGSRFPGDFRVPSLTYLAVDPNDGTLYCVYFDTTGWVGSNRNVDLYFCKSVNQGSSWTTPVIINGDGDPPGDQFWPWLEVDNAGRIHMIFYDSRHTVQNDNAIHGMFDAYYSMSRDGGQSWSEFRLTPAPFDSYYDGLDRYNQFLGDYNGLGLAGNRVYPCYLSTQNLDSDIFVNVITVGLLGDLNCDDVVDGFDVQAFVLALTDPLQYEALYPGCDRMLADCNGDGVVDAYDIQPFVNLLVGK